MVGRAVGVERNQQRLSGQSSERDPGLLAPALSLDLHSNCHQGCGAEGGLSWPPAGRRGVCFCTSLGQEGLWAGLLSHGRETESQAVCSRKGLGPVQNKGNPGPTLLGECGQVMEPETAVSGWRQVPPPKSS